MNRPLIAEVGYRKRLLIAWQELTDCGQLIADKTKRSLLAEIASDHIVCHRKRSLIVCIARGH
eukprot:3062695-Rhodomonas_salina.1